MVGGGKMDVVVSVPVMEQEYDRDIKQEAGKAEKQ